MRTSQQDKKQKIIYKKKLEEPMCADPKGVLLKKELAIIYNT